MIILPKGMFDDVTDPDESPFHLCAQQERDISLVLTPKAGWYNHYGQVLSQGDLALHDFRNIMNALENLEQTHDMAVAPFIVVPFRDEESLPYRTLSQHELAARCTFVITARNVISFDSLTPTLINIFHNNGIKVMVGRRKGIHEVLGDYLIH